MDMLHEVDRLTAENARLTERLRRRDEHIDALKAEVERLKLIETAVVNFKKYNEVDGPEDEPDFVHWSEYYDAITEALDTPTPGKGECDQCEFTPGARDCQTCAVLFGGPEPGEGD